VTAAAVESDGGAELLSRFAGSEAEVEAQLAHALGEPADLGAWSRLRAELARPPVGDHARVRLAARPSDVAILCRGLAVAAGEGAAELALARAGVFGLVPNRALAEVAAFAERAGATFALERAPGAEPAECDAFGAPPPALGLMRALKARFDPARVLSPGRFVARI
jgi:hypothetical protein